MNKPLVLVVEDDLPIQNLITTTLRAHEYHFLTANTGEEAIMETASHNPEIVLLDLGLPDLDGVEVIRRIRTWSNLPIIVISARSEDTDKIDALDAGADDYLTKPFSVEELLARLRVTQRRLAVMMSETLAGDAVFSNGKLKIEDDFIAAVKGKQVTIAQSKILKLIGVKAGEFKVTARGLVDKSKEHFEILTE